MPRKPKTPCPAPACAELTDGGRCAKHRREREHERGSAAQRGYGARHRQWREAVLATDPLCVMCLREHRIRASVIADHIVPLPRPNWWDGDWSIENGQGLCKSCHDERTARMNRGWR